MSSRTSIACLLATASLFGQETMRMESATTRSLVTGPRLGVWQEGSRGEVRSILGLPGAAHQVGLTLPEVAAERLLVSPSQEYVLGPSQAKDALLLLRESDGQWASRRVEGGWADATLLAASPEGRAAALYVASSRRLQVLGGLPGEPAVLGEHDLSSLGEARQVTVSDDGSTLLLAVSEGDNGVALYTFTSENGARRVLATGDISSISFVGRSRDAVIADASGNRVLRLRDAGGESELIVLATEEHGVAGPSAVAAAEDGQRVFVANRRSNTLLVLGLGDGARQTLECGFEPTGLHRLNGRSLFRLNSRTDGPLWLLDASGAEPRLVFVPPTTDEGRTE